MWLDQNNTIALKLPANGVCDNPAKISPPAKRDHALQLSRRIDWRFLLPEPALRRVAYLGPDRGTLLPALREFCDSVEIISSASCAKNNSPLCNLAVVCSRSLADLARAHACLAAGGYLYWEVGRGSRHGLSRTMKKHAGRNGELRGTRRYFRDCIAALEGLGFGEVEINWHRPNFAACLEIIPLDNQHALDYVFSRLRSSFAGRLKFVAGRCILKTGLLFCLVPGVSLIARKIT